jgi:RNA polymerase sigma-70 factor (ECF subfamily)
MRLANDEPVSSSPADGDSAGTPASEPAAAAHEVDAAALYERYAPMVYRRILRFFSPSEAEEIVQDIFLLVLEGLEHFRGEAQPSTWLYRVTTNHCLNRLRQNRRRRHLLEEQRSSLWYVNGHAPAQESTVFLGQLWHRLTDELALVGIYYYVDGLTHEQIAELVGVSRRTVGNRIQEIEQLARQACSSDDGARKG